MYNHSLGGIHFLLLSSTSPCLHFFDYSLVIHLYFSLPFTSLILSSPLFSFVLQYLLSLLKLTFNIKYMGVIIYFILSLANNENRIQSPNWKKINPNK